MIDLAVMARRVAALFRRSRLDDELRDEMAQHLEWKADALFAEGMDRDEARRRAAIEVGNVTKLREETRAMWGFPPLDTIGQDLRYGWRLLRRSPAFTTAAVLSLAIGVGASAAVFSLADAMLLQKLPVRDPDSLVGLKWSSGPAMPFASLNGNSAQNAEGLASTSFSLVAFTAMQRDAAQDLDLFGFSDLYRVNIAVGGRSDLGFGHAVSGTYFGVLGVPAVAGRTILSRDDAEEAPPVVVISHAFWTRQFQRSPDAIGKSLQVNGLPFTIVGVTPAGFRGTGQVDDAPDLYVPLAMRARVTRDDNAPADPTYWWVLIMGRLRPGVTSAQAAGILDVVLKQTSAAARPTLAPKDLPRVQLLAGNRGQIEAREEMREPIRTMAVVVAIVMLVACANVANLLLARGRARVRELSVRVAIGAARSRVVRQLFTEGVLIAALGSALGVIAAHWIAGALMPALTDTPLASVGGLGLNVRVLAFVVGLAAACAILFALAPALRATDVTLVTGLQESGRSAPGARHRNGLQSALVIVQMALSIVLVATAALLVQSVRNLQHVDLGFDAGRVLLFGLDPTLNGYDPARVRQIYASVLDRLRAMPGVRAASFSDHTLISNSASVGVASEPGEALPQRGTEGAQSFFRAHSAWRLTVDPQFFTTMGLRVLRGRGFTDADIADGQKVAVINRALAQQLFKTDDVVGRRFRVGLLPTGPVYEVIGVSADARYTSVRRPMPPTLYLSCRQQPAGRATFEVKTDGDPELFAATARDAVRSVDANLPLLNVRSQQSQIDESLRQEHLFARLSVLLGTVTVVLSAIGLYALLAYSVSRRRAEIGIRMALGAERSTVRWMILKQSLVLAGCGLALGIAGAMAGTKVVETLLYELPARDPLTLAAAASIMLAVSTLAGYLPAHRASRVDPLVALRAE